MAEAQDEALIDRLKRSLTRTWERVHRTVPGERVYGFGIYTSPCADSVNPFACGEEGLKRVAADYVARGTYAADEAAENLRWSVADSPYADHAADEPESFAGRPNVYELPDRDSEREIRFRLNAACEAIKQLDAAGLFGTGADREQVVLWLEGGDVTEEWTLKWAKKLNPPAVFERFKSRDGQPTTIGTYTEFGTKKVYQSSRYASTADGGRVAVATYYHLFLYETAAELKQVFARQLPDRADARSLWDVAISDDGRLIAVTPFGSDVDDRFAWLVTGPAGKAITTIKLTVGPTCVAVDPAGHWVAVGCGNGVASIFDAAGEPIRELTGGKPHYHGDMAVSADGSRLAWADGSGTVRTWATADWSAGVAIRDRADVIAFDPTGRHLAATMRWLGPTGSTLKKRARLARIFDAETGRLVRDVEVPGFEMARAVFSPSGRQLACALKAYAEAHNLGEEVALVDVDSGRVVDRLKADFEAVYDFAFLPGRGEVAVAVYGHTRRPLVLWKPKGLAGGDVTPTPSAGG